jgi:hypothetical protein
MKTTHSKPSQLSKCLLTCVALLAVGAHRAGAQGKVVGRPYLTGAVAVSVTVSESVRARESEPNDRLTIANEAALGNVIHGRIDRPKDYDVFAVTVAEGTALDLEVAARSIGSPLDPTLSLFNGSGLRLAHSIDAAGLGSHIRITVPSAGRYYISVRGFGGSGGAEHAYRLTIKGMAPGSAHQVVDQIS